MTTRVLRALKAPLSAAAALLFLGLRGQLLAQPAPLPDLEAELAALRVPPAWLTEVHSTYDVTKPWKEARLQVRQLLDQQANREAVALTYDYVVVRKATPDDHEYALYLYLGGEYAWATKVYRERLAASPAREGIDYANLASLYLHFGKPQDAVATLEQGLEHLPKAPWDVPNQAKLNERLGDVRARLGDKEQARRHYEEAAALYPTSKQPWGRETLPKHVLRLEGKSALLQRGHGRLDKLAEGTTKGSAIGYAGEVAVELEVRQGRVADLRLSHREHIDQGASRRLPAEILRRQSLEVDAITAATVTRDAIVEATYRAARQAGLK